MEEGLEVLIARIDERVKQLVDLHEGTMVLLKEHALRLEKLEQWQSRILGMAIIVSILLPVVIGVVMHIMGI